MGYVIVFAIGAFFGFGMICAFTISGQESRKEENIDNI